MACEFIKQLWVFSLVLFVSNSQYYLVNGLPQIPCYFVFGDSLSDTGNNNFLLNAAKANFLPYGIDFPQGPTGRFSNGRNLVDVIAQLVGFDSYIPPFFTARGPEILKGVNYASGSAGILPETGKTEGEVLCLDTQLLNHQSIVKKIVSLMGNHELLAAEYLGKCLYTVGMGTNDYIINYFLSQPTSFLYTPQQYAEALIAEYSQQLKTLYNSGARMIALFGLGKLGSIPFEITGCGIKGSLCMDQINSAVHLFNARLKLLAQELNTILPNAKFTYIDYYGIEDSYIASFRGSLVTHVACCISGSKTGGCIPSEIPCKDRIRHLFWDGIHPSEATNVAIAARSYKALLPTDAFPYDISHLTRVL